MIYICIYLIGVAITFLLECIALLIKPDVFNDTGLLLFFSTVAWPLAYIVLFIIIVMLIIDDNKEKIKYFFGY